MMLPSVPLDRHDAGQRARFDALRRKIFDEIGQSGAKWRLAWVVPFNVAVIGLLAWRGEPLARVLIQSAATVACALIFVSQILRPRAHGKVMTVFVGSLCVLVGIGATGGLGSPLLVTAVLIMQGAAVS